MNKILTVFLLLFTLHANAQEKPNIIFFLVDDLGYKDVGFTGSEYYQTPNIDGLAEQGMVFSQSYMTPTCISSRASLMTGQYPPRTDIYSVEGYARTPDEMEKVKPVHSERELDSNAITIAEVLKNAGYVTGHFGKWHLGLRPETWPEAQGFDVNVAGCGRGAPESYFSPYLTLKNIEPKSDDEYLTDRLTDEAINFIAENREQPFFLYFPFYSVHVPLHAKREMVELYEGHKPDGLQNVAAYGAMVSTVDQSIAKIMEALRNYGLEKNTIVVFTSDNGGQTLATSNAPLRGQKGNVYEGGIRVPTFIKWPGHIKEGSVSSAPVTVVDYFPTIVKMANAQVPEGIPIDGVDLLPLLKGKQKSLERGAIYWHVPNYHGNGIANAHVWQYPASVVRKGDWKLIQNLEDGSLELYNLKYDTSESNDIVSLYPEKANQLLKELKEWQNKIGAPIPDEPNPDFISGSREWIRLTNQRVHGQWEKQTIVK